MTPRWREPDSNHRSPENADLVSRLTFSPLRHSRSVEETAHFRERDRWFESGSLHRGVRCEPDLLRPERDLAVLFVRAEIESSPQTQIEPSRFESLSRIALVAATPGIIDRRRLSLHPDKTRLIEFGRFAVQHCKKRGLSKPETFKFLGFVLICGKSRRGDFQIKRKSRRDRMRTKLREIKEALRRRMHRPIPETGKWLGKSLPGISPTMPCRPMARRLLHFATTSSSSGIGGCAGAAREHAWYGRRWRSWRTSSFPGRVSCTLGPVCALQSDTRGRSRVPELGSLGSVRGALSNERHYHERGRTGREVRRWRIGRRAYRPSLKGI